MPAATPITDDDLAALFAGFARYRLLLLAVSGGADSTALMHLVARWRARVGPDAPQIHVATVDHALRLQSRSEAEAVAAAARELDLPHHRLTWTGAKPATGLQAAAREARYALLGAKLGQLGEPDATVVTGHTANDQAETLLMRLARGSGLHGLAAMSSQRPLQPDAPFALLRPLLGVSRQRILATLRAGAITWSEDPSNQRSEFERVRLRAAAPTLEALGLTPDQLSRSAARLQRARAAIDAATSDLEARVLQLNDGAFAAIEREAFAAAPAEVRLRLLLRVLSRFGGLAPPPRLSRAETLLDRLAAGKPLTATLGGCVIAAGAKSVRVYRERGRITLPEYPLACGVPVEWDARFVVSADAPASSNLTVRALGVDGYATVRDAVARPLPSQVAATLPALWQGGSLLAVPLLALQRAQGPTFSFRADFLGLPDDPHICD